MLDIHPDSPTHTLAHAADLLRCASATAYESADYLSGTKRDLALSVVHLIDLARGVVEKSLDKLEA